MESSQQDVPTINPSASEPRVVNVEAYDALAKELEETKALLQSVLAQLPMLKGVSTSAPLALPAEATIQHLANPSSNPCQFFHSYFPIQPCLSHLPYHPNCQTYPELCQPIHQFYQPQSCHHIHPQNASQPPVKNPTPCPCTGPYPYTYPAPMHQNPAPATSLPPSLPSHAVQKPRPAKRKPRVFTPLGCSLSQAFTHLLATGKLVPIPAKPIPNPLPRSFKPNTTCAFHSGQPGHDTDHCLSLRHSIQNLIDSNQVKMEALNAAAPNVNNNLLPTYDEKGCSDLEKMKGPENASSSLDGNSRRS